MQQAWVPSVFVHFLGRCGKTVKRSMQSNDVKTETRTSPKDWEMDLNISVFDLKL